MLEQEKAQLQGTAVACDEIAEEVEDNGLLSQELLDGEMDYKAALVINNPSRDDVINTNENQEYGHFEPLIHLDDNKDVGEF